MAKQKDSFASRLKLLIKTRGISQRELARKSGLGHADINQYVNGRKLPSIPSLLKIAQALEVLPGTMIDRLGVGWA
jgi:transcriptional regulator with XRE-family HTH domain